MIEKQLRELWDNLQGKKPHLPHFLSEIRLDGIRGLDNLRVLIDYPRERHCRRKRHWKINSAFCSCMCL